MCSEGQGATSMAANQSPLEQIAAFLIREQRHHAMLTQPCARRHPARLFAQQPLLTLFGLPPLHVWGQANPVRPAVRTGTLTPKQLPRLRFGIRALPAHPTGSL
jgi:hypothetical protein